MHMHYTSTGGCSATRSLRSRRNPALLTSHGACRPALSRKLAATVQAFDNSVPVTISMKFKVDFGETFKIVGNQPFLGNWDPKKGADMVWTDGNVWKFDVNVPIGDEVNFKFVKLKEQQAEWEDGDNRTFKILGPDYGLKVTCHWAKSQDTKIDVYPLTQEERSASTSGKQAAKAASSSSSNGVPAAPAKEAASHGEPQPAKSPARSSVDQAPPSNARSSMDLSRSSFEDEARASWVGADPQFVRSRQKDGERRGVWRLDGLKGVAYDLVKGDEHASSWLKKLELQKRLLVDGAPMLRPSLEAMAAVYVYATWVNTGAITCAESGAHYRPNHHANLSLEMFRSLEWVIGDAGNRSGPRSSDAEKAILAARRLHTRLPSFSGEFRVSTPLTRIRDIAHRNDIPKDLKDEIKHTLQNKLHRSAGPEDLVATEAMLARVTANPGEYNSAFVEEFKIFTKELREFFNASGLNELLEGTLDALDEPHGAAVRQFLNTKGRVEAAGQGAKLDDLMSLLQAATQARSFYAAGLVAGLRNDVTDAILSTRQRWRLADIRLEEYSFVVLSRIIGKMEEMDAPKHLPRAGNLQWALPLAALTSGLRNMGLSQFAIRELLVLESELQAWHGTSPLVETRDAALRAKASLERVLRLASEYSDAVADVYAGQARKLGSALGVPEHMGTIFAEAEVRASMAFQVSKLAALLTKALRQAAGQDAWDVLVPGEVTGVLREAAQLDPEALGRDEEGVVLMVRRADGDEELGTLGPRLRGVVLCQDLPHLSHLGVRARQENVPFVTVDDDELINKTLRPLLGKRVKLSIIGNTVTIREAAAAGSSGGNGKHAAAAAPSRQAAGSAAVAAASVAAAAADAGAMTAVARAVAAGKWQSVLVPLEQAVPSTCGSKSSKCAALQSLAAASHGLFRTPRGVCLPFGTMEAVVSGGSGEEARFAGLLEGRFRSLLERLDDPSLQGAELESACGEMQALVAGLHLPKGLIEQVQAAMGSAVLLAVRSSASVEDLAGMSAAGLYESVVGVAAQDASAVGAAIAAVWASLYTRRAVLSRRAAGLRQSDATMGVLVMELVVPEYSFVLHTARPRDGNTGVLMAEVAPGHGETLASGKRGTPWRFEVDKVRGDISMLASANFSTALVLPKKGIPVGAAVGRHNALIELEVDYGSQRMSSDKDWRAAAVRAFTKAGVHIEQAMDGVPQDIEGGLVAPPRGAAVTAGGNTSGAPDGLQLYIFQTRPQ